MNRLAVGGLGGLGVAGALYYRSMRSSQTVSKLSRDVSFVEKLHVKPYGVLGSSLGASGFQMNGPAPSTSDVILDPAGHHHIQKTPEGAGGAAGSIYKWLQPEQEKTKPFPEAVRQGIKQDCDAKYFEYAPAKKVIHVVGPDFRKHNYSREEAIDVLATAYYNTLREFAENPSPNLRLLPISGGIFSGSFGPELPGMTAEALKRGFSRLDDNQQAAVTADQINEIQMCIFMEKELADFEQQFQAMLK